MSHFSDPRAVERYLEGPVRMVPGLLDMHRIAALLLAERVPDDGRVLVLGAGGGMELRAFAERHPGWWFDGIAPSAEMLALAGRTLGPLASRARLHRGTIDAAPDGLFDGATCLLTLHFLPRDERLRTLGEIHRRLKPGAPFVAVHHSFPDEPDQKARWLARFAAYATGSGVPADAAANAAAGIGARLPALPPEEDESLLREAGFSDVGLFYAALTFRGWVAYG